MSLNERKRIHTDTVQEFEADRKKYGIARGYFCLLDREMQTLVLKELEISDVVNYIAADNDSEYEMKNNRFLWKQLADQEYPVFSQIAASDENNCREKLLSLDHQLSKFVKEDCWQLGKLHGSCLPMKTNITDVSGPIRSTGNRSIYTVRKFNGSHTEIHSKLTASIIGKEHTPAIFFGEKLITVEGVVKHIEIQDNFLSLSVKRGIGMEDHTGGLRIYDVNTSKNTFLQQVQAYQYHEADRFVIAALQSGNNNVIDIFDLRMKELVKSIDNSVLIPIRIFGGLKCTPRHHNGKVYYVSHGPSRTINFIVQDITIDDYISVQLQTNAASIMDAFNYAVDVQGGHALVAYDYAILPDGMFIKCVLINLQNMQIEEDYSEVLALVFQFVACRYRSRFTLVKLKYDVVIVALDNHVIVLDRTSGAIKWSFSELSLDQVSCVHNPEIDFTLDHFLIRNCKFFNSLENGSSIMN